MPTYRLEITYANDRPDTEPQVHTGLDPEQAETGAWAFLSDLIHLEGNGVAKLTVAIEES